MAHYTRFSQKAPSAKRCIKTALGSNSCRGRESSCQKAPSAKRCIKTLVLRVSEGFQDGGSESTERQKVH